MTIIPGLDASGLGATAAARRERLAALSDAAIGERLAAMAGVNRVARADLTRLHEAAGLPEAEVWASPFGLRAVTLGVEVGSSTRPHELRRRARWPREWSPEAVRDEADAHWDAGTLKVGKYQGFLQDEPLATYNPAHDAKWGPHELMHRAAGVLARPGLGRFDRYLGSRLNELVPVVLWYGPDQALRLDTEGPFDRVAAALRPAARLEDARWLTLANRELGEAAQQAAPLVREGLAHFERELAAIDESARTGQRVRVPHAFLDASSDATAYVVGHDARLRDPHVAAPHEALAGPAALVFTDVAAYREHIERLFDRLLFEPLAFDEARAEARREARRLWDLTQRAAHLGGPAAEAAIELAPELSALVTRAYGGEGPTSDESASFVDRLTSSLPAESRAEVLEDGSAEGLALEQLLEGLGSFAPRLTARLGAERVEAFARSGWILDRAPLAERLDRFLVFDEAPTSEREHLRFERAVVEAHPDDAAEHLADLPSEVGRDVHEGSVIASPAFVTLAFEEPTVSRHMRADGQDPPEAFDEVRRWWVGHHEGGVSIVPAPGELAPRLAELLDAGPLPVADVLEALEEERPDGEAWPRSAEDWLEELLDSGVLIWRAPTT